jgi:hypothetical protein
MIGRAKACWRTVRDVVGPHSWPRVVARSPALRRLRAVAVTGTGLGAGFVALLTAPRETDGALAVLLTILTVAPALLAIRWPLGAWQLLVLFVVATAYEQAVLFVVAAVTTVVLALWIRDWRDLVLLMALPAVVLVVGNAVRQRRVAELDSAEPGAGSSSRGSRSGTPRRCPPPSGEWTPSSS